MMPADTLPRLLRRNAATMGARPAMREKRHGIWQTLTWSGYETLVLQIARGLAARGFRAGDRLAIMGDNRPQLYAALLAAQSLGGIGVPLWPDADPAAIAVMLNNACVRMAVAEDQEQIGKLRAAKDQLPDLELAVSLDPRAARDGDAAWLIDFATLQRQGAASTAPVDGIADGRPDQVALLLCRTGQPGVMLSHANLLSGARSIAEDEEVRPTDDALCFLPMAWIGDVLYSLTLGLSVGFTCNCPESPETAARDLREIGPNFLAAPPVIWESWLRAAEDRGAHASRVKRAAFGWARRVAEAAEHRREAGLSRGGTRLLADRLVFAALRDQLGLSRLRWAHTGGMPVAAEVWRLFHGFGVNLMQTYGPAELAGLVTVHRTGPAAADTVGFPAPGTEIRIAGDGEVQVRGNNVCLGYDGGSAATRARTTDDGWWRTGEAGALDATGRLTIHDRLADIGRLADGTRFMPGAIEAHLRRSRFIADALAFADGEQFVAAIIAPHRAALAEWAERHRLSGTSLAQLVALPETRALIREELRACNAGLPAPLHVRRFLLLDHPLEAEDAEARLYRDRFRRLAIERYAGLADALFRDPLRSTEVPAEDAAVRPAQAMVEDVEGPVVSRLEPAHA
ncbi:MAG TPA: AMP-binding protein [Acetobacteraceae bacterium]|nr:AMP-binding protein [Acetobacteraceae bacterium]